MVQVWLHRRSAKHWPIPIIYPVPAIEKLVFAIHPGVHIHGVYEDIVIDDITSDVPHIPSGTTGDLRHRQRTNGCFSANHLVFTAWRCC